VGRAVSEVTEAEVAAITEQATYPAGVMAVIDCQGIVPDVRRLFLAPAADRAAPVLISEYRLILLKSDAVLGHELEAAVSLTGPFIPARNFFQ
jgi:hypothetical protein